MSKMMIAALAAATALTCATPAFAQKAKLGKGDYFVQVAPEIDKNGNVTPRRLTTGQFDLILKLDELCRVDAKKYSPSEFKTVFLTFLRNVPGAMLGGGLGSLAGGFPAGSISATDYGLYNGVATGGGSFGAGFTAQAYGKKGFMGSCMTNMLTEIRRQGHGYMINGVYIIYNTFPVNGHAIRRSDLPSVPLANKPPEPESTSDNSTSDDQSQPAVPPPHG